MCTIFSIFRLFYVAQDTEKRQEELREFGVFFDDDYNYLQHLKEAVVTVELVAAPPAHGEGRAVHRRDGDAEEGNKAVPVS